MDVEESRRALKRIWGATIRRRRFCKCCGNKITTYEIPKETLDNIEKQLNDLNHGINHLDSFKIKTSLINSIECIIGEKPQEAI